MTVVQIQTQLDNVSKSIQDIEKTPARSRTQEQKDKLKEAKKERTKLDKELKAIQEAERKEFEEELQEIFSDAEVVGEEEQEEKKQEGKLPVHQTPTLTVTVNALDSNFDGSKLKVRDLNLVPDYWSPEQSGETKLLIFWEFLRNDEIPDMNDPNKTVIKDSCIFIEVKSDKKKVFLKCSATRLVSVMRFAAKGEVYQVTFVGKKKNKSNNYMSNVFEVYPLELA
jgi:hypothetical protein